MSNTKKIQRSDGIETRQRLKIVAQRLFALHGVDSISVKDIVEAAGQRNNASLHYHFGSKEALIGELLIDGAREIDALRQAMLDEMVAAGGPRTVREVLEALVHPVSRITDGDGQESTYIRFLSNVQMNHRALVRQYLGEKWNEGYRRCLDHLRQLLPGIVPPLLEQRMSLMGIYANAVFSAKEAALGDAHGPNRFWAQKYTTENIIDTLQAVLDCTPSPATLALLEPASTESSDSRRGKRTTKPRTADEP